MATPRLDGRIGYGELGYDRPMQLRIDIDPGFSGGPVFDEQGLLQGMIIGFDLRRDASGELVGAGRAYAIPADVLMDTAREWMATSRNN